MKNYDETVNTVFDRIRAYNIKKKRRTVLACRITAACCAVTLLGGSVWYLNRPQHDIPVTIAPDEDKVTTTTVDVPTENEDTTTTANNTTDTNDTTTDGGIVTPPTTTAPAPSKTEPPKTTTSTTHSKTEPTTVTQTRPTATQTTPTTLPTTAPTQSKPQPTTTPTVPQKIVITADEPDVYGDASPDGILSLYKKYISPALQEKMKLHSNDNVVFSVIVELPLTVEDYNSFSSTDEELLRLEKERDIASQEFEDALEQYGWTEDVREMQKKLQRIASEWEYLLHELTMEYLLGVLDQRINELTHLSENAPIPISTDTRFKPLFAFNADYAFFMELTADEINELAERGGYVIRLVFPDGDGEIIVLD